MNKDLALVISVIALCAVTAIGSILYKHVNDVKLHNPCDGQCCPDVRPAPAPFKPRRPGGSTGEVGKIDGVLPRDM